MGIFKKSVAVFLAVLMLLSVATVVAFADEEAVITNYYVTGSKGLTGTSDWVNGVDADAELAASEDAFVKTFKDVEAGSYVFKVIGCDAEGKVVKWIGDGNDNFSINVTKTCDVTITLKGEEVTIDGEGITNDITFKTLSIAGNSQKDPGFLHGVDWAPAETKNQMTTEDNKVYTITFYSVASGYYEWKICADSAWTHSWGTDKEAAEGVAVHNGDNIGLDVEKESNVTITVDATNYNVDGTGMTYAVEFSEPTAEPVDETTPVQETTEAPTTTAPVEEETTTAPVEEETTTAPVVNPATPEEQATTAPATDAPATGDTPATSDTPATGDTPSTGDETQPVDKPIVPGFYVVGSEEVCGAEWGWEKPWNYGVPMTAASDGTYFQVFENIKASAGNETEEGNDIYVFKVVYVNEKGGITWHPGGMGNNTKVTVAEDGSTILFQFKLLASNPQKEGSDPEAVIATVYGPNEEKPSFEDPKYPEVPEETTVAPTEAPTEQPTTVAPTEAPTVKPTTPAKTTTKKTASKAKASVPKKAPKATAKTLKKKGIKVSKLIKITKTKGAKVTYKILKKGTSKKIYKKIYVKGSKIKLKKKASIKKGTYKIKLKIKISATKKVKAKTIKKVVKLKIK